jgi:hypothetical protein
VAVTAEVKVAAKKKVVGRVRSWLRERHWAWVALVFITWQPLQAGAAALIALLGGWLPFIGPAALAAMTSWVDDVLVFAYATVVGPEILRRLGFWDDD